MKGRNGSRGVETTQQTSVHVEHVKQGKGRQSFGGMHSTFQRQPRNVRLLVAIAGLAIAFLLGVFFLSYGSKLYENWRDRHLLEKATTPLHDEEFGKAAELAQQLAASQGIGMVDSCPQYLRRYKCSAERIRTRKMCALLGRPGKSKWRVLGNGCRAFGGH